MADSVSVPPRTARPSPDGLYEAVFANLPDPAAILDAERRVITVNALFEARFGPGPWRGRMLDPLLADPLDMHAAPWRRSHPLAARVKGGDGTFFPALIRFAPIESGGGVAVFGRDEGAAARLEAHRARLSETFAAPRSGAFGMDLVTGQGQVSGFLADAFGAPEAGALSRSDWLGALEPSAEAVIDEALAGARGRLFAPIRFTVRLKAGGREMRALRHDLSVAALQEDGRPARLTGAVSDVTDLAFEIERREDAERALALSVDLGGLTRWSHDPETGRGQIEGPLAAAFGGPEFSQRRWSPTLSDADARSLNAALCLAEYGGRVDLCVDLPDHRCIIRGERLQSGRVEGFMTARPRASATGGEPRSTGEAAASAGMSAWTYDVAAKRLRLQGPVLDLLGLAGPEQDLDIADWRGLVVQDDHPRMDAATKALNTDGVADVEYRVRAADGRPVWLNLRGGVSEQDAAGQALRFSGFLYDVSARKRLERRLAEREQQLADAVDAGLAGIWTYDYAARTQTARGRILDWMGKPRDCDTISPADWLEVIHPDHHDALTRAFKALRAGRPVQPLDMRVRTPQGWRWVRTHGAPLDNDADGAPRRAAGVIIDIHAEHALQEALGHEKERFDAVYRKTPALLHSIDPTGRTLSVSDYWLERMGYRREEVVGAPGWAFMEAASAERVRKEVLPRTLEQGRVQNEPVVCLTAQGERLELRLSAFLETDSDGRPVAAHGAFHDVTDLKTAQRALEARAAELERANRELNRFATAASHDLQEPLRKISAFASLLRRSLSGSLGDQDEQALAFLIDAAGRMRVLIDDLLAYSRASNRALELKPVALGALIENVMTGLDLQILEADAWLDVGDLPTVTGDEVLLGLLFQNLIANALKYRKDQGVRITISAAPASDGVWAVTVGDDGIGFDPAFAEKIFEPFARLHTREAFSGTGIGLAICQQAAERLGGRIKVSSAPGAGAAFTVFLRASQGDDAELSAP